MGKTDECPVLFRHGNSPQSRYFQRKSDCIPEGGNSEEEKYSEEKKKSDILFYFSFFLENFHFRADLTFRSARSEPAFCFTVFKIKCRLRMLYALRNCAYR